MGKNEILFKRGQEKMPGGVNSPVRAFTNLNRSPLAIKKANGPYIYDIEGNCYIDYINSWGPMILGHNHPAIRDEVMESVLKGLSFGATTEIEVEMAALIVSMVPDIEMVRMVNSGTEAVMSALRLARGYTGKKKIIKFEGCYHGHCDAMLVKAGSGLLSSGIPSSCGVPEGASQDTLIATYNDLESVEKLCRDHKGDIAAIIVEPVAANMGVVPPKTGFLSGLRQICDTMDALLIFDEVITGFRLAKGGAQSYFKTKADIVVLGKIIGGGMPVGAYGATRKIMEMVSPLGPVYQAGTLSGNPIAMAAGFAQLTILNENGGIYDKLNQLGELLANGIRQLGETYRVPVTVNQVGSLVGVFFLSESNEAADNYGQATKSNQQLFKAFFNFLLDEGINIAPSPFEAMFISNAHEVMHIEETLHVIELFFKRIGEEK